MHIFSKKSLPKTGLLVGVVLGSALVYQVSNALEHVTIRDVWQAENGAVVIQAMRRDQSLASKVKLLPQPGSTIDSSEIISWEPIPGASDYRVFIGTYKGGVNVGHLNAGNETMVVVDNIPQNSEPIFVRLSYKINGSEQFFDTTYVTGDSSLETETVATENPFNPTSKKIK
jgi:hypothetical protein